jgi:hypothetical protein
MVANRARKSADEGLPTKTSTPITVLLMRDREVAERLMAVVAVLLWAEMAASSGRNDARLPWFRLGPAARPMRGLRRARRSVSGRRARG